MFSREFLGSLTKVAQHQIMGYPNAIKPLSGPPPGKLVRFTKDYSTRLCEFLCFG